MCYNHIMSDLTELEKNIYSKCNLCPRKCHVNRLNGEIGFCKMGTHPVVARAALHFWEEPCISGKLGSGAVFFSGCNLQCIFCQNKDISTQGVGKQIDRNRLSEIFLELQAKGAHNINLVTGVMFIPTIVESLRLAKSQGLTIPIIYNCGGYESLEGLKLLKGYIDVYLPDFKYLSEINAKLFSKADNYPKMAKEAIEEMVKQTGSISFDQDGMVKRGVIVRHLLLPGQRKEAEQILDYLYQEYGEAIYYSIMNQYTPMPGIAAVNPSIARKVTTYEYQKVIDYALDIGITKGYMQEGQTAKESFIPAFDFEGV